MPLTHEQIPSHLALTIKVVSSDPVPHSPHLLTQSWSSWYLLKDCPIFIFQPVPDFKELLDVPSPVCPLHHPRPLLLLLPHGVLIAAADHCHRWWRSRRSGNRGNRRCSNWDWWWRGDRNWHRHCGHWIRYKYIFCIWLAFKSSLGDFQIYWALNWNMSLTFDVFHDVTCHWSFTATGAAGTMGLLGSSGPLAMLLSTVLPGLGLGLLKGMFIAEILQKSNKKSKGYDHHHDDGYDHKQQKRREFYPSQRYRDDDYPDPYSYSTQFWPHSSDADVD